MDDNGSDDEKQHGRRKMRTPEPGVVRIAEREVEKNDGDSEHDERDQREMENGGWGVDVMRTTKIEVVSQSYCDEDVAPTGTRNLV